MNDDAWERIERTQRILSLLKVYHSMGLYTALTLELIMTVSYCHVDTRTSNA